MMNGAKALVQSKVFWLAVLQGAIGLTVAFSTSYPDAGWLLTAKSVLDIVLRLYTTQPVGSVLPRA